MQNTRQRSKNILKVITDGLSDGIPVFLGVFSVLTVLYFIIFPSRGYFHSDCSDYLLWAAETAETGKLVNPSYHYAALLPFGAPLWLVPLIKMFGLSMKTHIIGMCIFAVLFVASAFFFMRSLGWSIKKSSVGIFIMLSVVSSSEKLREIFHMHVLYYSLAPLIMFLILGISIRLMRSFSARSPRSWIGVLCIAALAIGSGFDGLQIIALAILPAAAAIIADIYFGNNTGFFDVAEAGDGSGRAYRRFRISREDLTGTLIAVGTVVLSVLGYLIFLVITGGAASSYVSSHSSWSSPDQWFENFSALPRSYFTLLEVNPERYAPFTSFESILYLLRMALGILLLVIPIIRLIEWKRLPREKRWLVAIYYTVCAVVLFAFVFGTLSDSNWRLSPLLLISSLLSFDFLCDKLKMRHSETDKKTAAVGAETFPARRLAVICLAVIICFSLVTCAIIVKMPHDYGMDNDLWQLAGIIEDHGLEYGYATFWTSQSLTIICGCKPRVVNVVINQSSGCTPGKYQSNDEWYEKQPGVKNYFIIANEYEYQEYTNLLESRMWERLSEKLVDTIEYDGGRYYILVFDSYIW